jgi:hypothetical protein
VEDHDIAGPQSRDQDLLDVGEKRWIVERAVEDRGRLEAIHAQRRDHRMRLPMAAGRVIAEPQPSRTAPIAAQQVGGDPRFVDEDIAAGVVDREQVVPPPARGGDVRAPLFVGVYRFLTVTPSRSISRQSVLSAADVRSASRSSASVASGRAMISAANRSSWPASMR